MVKLVKKWKLFIICAKRTSHGRIENRVPHGQTNYLFLIFLSSLWNCIEAPDLKPSLTNLLSNIFNFKLTT